jgi:hypothetical protein
MRQFPKLHRYEVNPLAICDEDLMIETPNGRYYLVSEVQRRMDELTQEITDALTWGMPF